MADHASPQRPLPESLTRFLSAPGQPIRRRPEPRPPPEGRVGRPAPARSSASRRALQIVLLWALGYNLLGFTIIVLLWRSMN